MSDMSPNQSDSDHVPLLAPPSVDIEIPPSPGLSMFMNFYSEVKKEIHGHMKQERAQEDELYQYLLETQELMAKESAEKSLLLNNIVSTQQSLMKTLASYSLSSKHHIKVLLDGAIQERLQDDSMLAKQLDSLINVRLAEANAKREAAEQARAEAEQARQLAEKQREQAVEQREQMESALKRSEKALSQLQSSFASLQENLATVQTEQRILEHQLSSSVAQLSKASESEALTRKLKHIELHNRQREIENEVLRTKVQETRAILERLAIRCQSLELKQAEHEKAQKAQQQVIETRQNSKPAQRRLGRNGLVSSANQQQQQNLYKSPSFEHIQYVERHHRAASVIQRVYRSRLARIRFRRLVKMQLAARNQTDMVRQWQRKNVLEKQAATTIQRGFRSYLLRQRWRKMVRDSLSRGDDLRDSLIARSSPTPKRKSVGEIDLEHVTWESFEDPTISFIVRSDSEMTNEGSNVVKGGSLVGLVKELTSPQSTDPTFLKEFLYTFRDFCTPATLLRLLRVRYQIPYPESVNVDDDAKRHFKMNTVVPLQLRILKIIGTWVENHFYTLEDDPELVGSMFDFLRVTVATQYSVAANSLSELLRTKQREVASAAMGVEFYEFLADAPKPLLPRKVLRSGISCPLRDISAEEIARQMTLIDSGLFRSIQDQELFRQAWNKQRHRTPNVTAIIERFNQMSLWIATEIVTERDLRTRGKKLSLFVQIADKCFQLNNFQGTMQVLTGLGSSGVSRLKHTWAELGNHLTEKFERLSEVMNITSNFKHYRDHLKDVQPPAVPFLGVAISDLTFIDDGNPDHIDVNGNLALNFLKRSVMAGVLEDINRFKQPSYCLEPVTFIQEMLLNGECLEEKLAFEQSLISEPREKKKTLTPSERQQLVRRVTVSTLDGPNMTATPQYRKQSTARLSWGKNTTRRVRNTPLHESSPPGLATADGAFTASRSIETALSQSVFPGIRLHAAGSTSPAGSPRGDPLPASHSLPALVPRLPNAALASPKSAHTDSPPQTPTHASSPAPTSPATAAVSPNISLRQRSSTDLAARPSSTKPRGRKLQKVVSPNTTPPSARRSSSRSRGARKGGEHKRLSDLQSSTTSPGRPRGKSFSEANPALLQRRKSLPGTESLDDLGDYMKRKARKMLDKLTQDESDQEEAVVTTTKMPALIRSASGNSATLHSSDSTPSLPPVGSSSLDDSAAHSASTPVLPRTRPRSNTNPMRPPAIVRFESLH